MENGLLIDANTNLVRKDAYQNRERIMVMARQLFAEQGVESTSMNQIAQAAAVGAGTLYRNFANKGDLCLALLRQDLADFQNRIDTLLNDSVAPASALVRLESLLDALLTMIEMNMPLLLGMQDKPHSEIYRSPYYSWLHELFSSLLRDAVVRQEIPPLDVAFTADAIFAVVSPKLLIFQRKEKQFDRQRLLMGLKRLFIEGLK